MPTEQMPLSEEDVREIYAAITSGDSQLMYTTANVDNVRALCQTVRAQNNEVSAVLNALGKDAIHVREEGGPEDIYASLAVSVAKLQAKLSEVEKERDDLLIWVELTATRDHYAKHVGSERPVGPRECTENSCIEIRELLIRAAALPSLDDSIRAAAAEIMNEVGATSGEGWTFEEMHPLAESIEKIISKHLRSPQEAKND